MGKKITNFGKALHSQTCHESHNETDVLTFCPRENQGLLRELEQRLPDLLLKDDRLISNYQDFPWEDQVAISLLLSDREIVGFSTVWHRSIYAEKTVRVFNRWYEGEALRKNTNSVLSAHAVAALHHQADYARKAGFEWAFISREKNKKVVSRIGKEICEKTSLQFRTIDDKIPVCDPGSPSCWQWVCYGPLRRNPSTNWSLLNDKST